MSLNTAYSLLPLPTGDWIYWLPYPLMSFLFLALALSVLVGVAAWLHRQQAYPLLRNAILVYMPLLGGILYFLKVREWLFWTLGWFYGIVLLTAIVGIVNRKALPYLLAILLAALLQHQASVIMVAILAKT